MVVQVGVTAQLSDQGLVVEELSPICEIAGFQSLLDIGSYAGFDLHFGLDNAGHLYVSSDSYNLNAFWVSEGKFLLYDYDVEPLPIFREGDHIFVGDTGMDKSPIGFGIRPSHVEFDVFRGKATWG
jgi:hypothetical protein